MNLPTFEQIRSATHRELGDVLDGMRSDWRDGCGPDAEQAGPWHEAIRLVAAARQRLDEVARRADR